MQTETTKKKAVKPQQAKSELEMTAGMQAIQFNPNDITIVDKKHPLAEKLYLTRNDTVYDPGSPSVEEFKRQGQLQPIGVFPYKNPTTGKSELVVAFGVQRVLKCRAAGISVEAVPFKDWTPDDAEQAMIAENEQRINLSFKDQLMSVRRMIKMHRDAKTPKYFEVVAKLFGKSSHQWARDMYAVSNLPSKVLSKVPDVIPFASAIQLARTEAENAAELPVEQRAKANQAAQLAAFEEMMTDESNITQKGTKSVNKAISNRVGKKPMDRLSNAELRVIIADESLDLSLSDEDVRIVIAAIIGDKDVNEVLRAGIEWYKHVKTEKPKTGKAAKNARKEAAKKQEVQVSLDELEESFDDDDDNDSDEDNE